VPAATQHSNQDSHRESKTADWLDQDQQSKINQGDEGEHQQGVSQPVELFGKGHPQPDTLQQQDFDPLVHSVEQTENRERPQHPSFG
jgi:hypothetical protein